MRERELVKAVQAGDLNKVREMCKQGVDEDKAKEYGPDFRSSLLFAAIDYYIDYSTGSAVSHNTGHTEIVAYLLRRGANANINEHLEEDDDPARKNQTPLHSTARNGYKVIAALLIQNGGVVDAKWGATGYTPLAVAVSSYNSADAPDASEEKNERIFDTIRLLVENGADVNTRNNTKAEPDYIGSTILHRIAGRGNLIQYLVNAGADINAEDEMGMTPLHTAALYSKGATTATTAQALIEAGANPNVRDNKEKTPLDYAQNELLKALIQRSQAPKSSQAVIPETPAKGSGCMGIFAVVGTIVLVIVTLTLQ